MSFVTLNTGTGWRANTFSLANVFLQNEFVQQLRAKFFVRRFFDTIEWWCSSWIVGNSALLFFERLLPCLPLLCFSILLVLLRKYTLAHAFLPIVLSMLCSTWVLTQHWRIELPQEIESKNMVISGDVIGLPVHKASRVQFGFRISAIETLLPLPENAVTSLVGEVVELSCYRCPWEILPAEHWSFTVRLKRPHGYASWGAFDFEKYLFRKQIVARGYVRLKGNNALIAKGHDPVNEYRGKIKASLSKELAEYPLGGAVISALLIGDKSGLSMEQRRTFQINGISHLFAISGLHVGLVFVFMMFLFKWLLHPFAVIFNWLPRQRLTLIPCLTAAFTYSALAGFSVSTQRALIMLCVFAVCRFAGREITLFQVLLFAASLILVIDPFSILDAGFWLSCGAVFVIAISHHFLGALSLVKLQPLLWLGMMPLSVSLFGQVSLISPLVNLLMVPLFCLVLIPLVLLSLVLWSMGIASLQVPLMQNLARSFEALYDFLEVSADWSFALWFPSQQLVIGLMFCLLGVRLWRRQLLALVIFSASGTFILASTYQTHEDGEHRVTMLDVGQGLAMVVEVADYVLVYDTGPAYPSGFNATDAVLIPYLRDRGIKRIDTLIISHADNDHIGGLPYLRAAYPIGEVLTSRVGKVGDGKLCLQGQSWSQHGVTFEILGPDTGTPSGNNNLSCVLRVSNERYRTLITGDIEKQVERYMVNSAVDLRADFVLVPHHGSKTSSTRPFVEAIKPQVGLISAGYRNHYGHPHGAVVERYLGSQVELKSTVEGGSILLKINNKSYSSHHYRQDDRGFWHRQKKPNWQT